MNTSRVLVLLLAVAFALLITVSLASADYVVIKDKNGVCKVIQSNHKTPKTIEGGGPFKTKEEAERVKEQKCRTAGTIKETPPGSIGEIKTRSEQREEKINKARDLREEKAKQKPAEKEKAKKDREEKTKPKTSQ